MKIALVLAPYWSVDVPVLGLALISSVLKQAGHSVKIFDLNLEVHKKSRSLHLKTIDNLISDTSEKHIQIFEEISDNFIEILKRENFQVAGFSIFDTTYLYSSICVRKIKQHLPHIKVIYGGSAISDLAIARELLDHYQIDASVAGEGEKSILELIDLYSRNQLSDQSASIIPGVVYKNSNGRIIAADTYNSLSDLDALPFPDFTHFDLGKYQGFFRDKKRKRIKRKILPIMFSRGCVARCSFCGDTNRWKKFRFRSPESILDEIKHNYETYGISSYLEHGELMNGNHTQLEKLADIIIQNDLKVSWGGFCRVDKRLTPQLLDKLARAGCCYINYGLESGSQKIVDLMRKNFLVTDAVKVIKNTAKSGIGVHIGVIVGFPGETWLDYFKTIKLLLSLKKYIAQVNINILVINRDSYMKKHIDRYDVVLSDENSEDKFGEHWTSRNRISNTYIIRRLRSKLMRFILIKYSGISVDICS